MFASSTLFFIFQLQISAANKALVISKEHSEKLEQKMRLQLESTVSNMEKKHLCDTEVLKEKVCLVYHVVALSL